MFSFFKRRRSNNTVSKEQLYPGKVFPEVGTVFGALWNDFRSGEHKSVEKYKEFKTFQAELKHKYEHIRFDEKSRVLRVNDDELLLTIGEAMYIYIITNTVFTSPFDHLELYLKPTIDSSSVYKADYYCLKDLNNSCEPEEKQYCHDLISYLNTHIYPFVNETTKMVWGYSKVQNDSYPFYTSDYISYHQYLQDAVDFDKWKYIYKAPLFKLSIRSQNEENPVIVYDIRDTISAFVLDMLCFSAVAVSTQSYLKLIDYKDESGRVVREVLEQHYGKQMIDFMDQTVIDLNGDKLRRMIYMGLLLE